MSSMTERSKLFMFAALTMFGMGVGSALMYLIAQGLLPAGADIERVFSTPSASDQNVLKWANTGMLIGFFLFPVLVFRLMFGQSNALPLRWQKSSHWWWLAPFILIFLSGMADILGAFNTWLMEQLQWRSADEMQTNADHLQKLMLSPETPWDWFSTIVAVVIAPAILEELFFRGALQNLFTRVGTSHGSAIWASALIFSALHLQFEGFLPRLFLGVILGYLYHWSGSLTTAVIAHAFNNALALMMFTYFESFEWEISENRWVELLIGFGMGFIGIAITQWAYRRGHAPSSRQQE